MDSAGGNHQPGAQNEPFFDLLQQSAPTTSTSYTIPKKMENSGEFNFGGDDVLPSFDFQPIRNSAASSSSNTSSSSSAARIDENKGRQGSPPSSYTSYEPMVRRSREPPPTYETPISRSQEHEKESFDSATAAAVERTMKKYADNLLRVLEGMTGRLSQLELSTQRLEHLFGEVKDAVADSHGESDGKLRSLESHILEVQRGVQVLRDRQELFEAQSQLAKLQMTSKTEPAPAPALLTASSAPSAPIPVLEPASQLLRASSGKALMEAPPQQVSDAQSSSYYQPQPQLQLQQLPSLPTPIPSHPQSAPQQPQQHQQPPQHQHQHQQQPQQHHLQQQQLQQPVQLQQQSAPQIEAPHQTAHHQQAPPPPPPLQQSSHPPPHSQHSPGQYSQQQQPTYPQQQQGVPQQPPAQSYGHAPEAPSYSQHPQAPHPGPHHASLPPSYPSELPSYHPSYGPPRPGPPPLQQQSSQIPPGPQQQQPHGAGMYDPSLARNGSGHLSLPPPPYLPQSHPVSGAPHYESQALAPGSGYPGSSYRLAQPVPSAPSGGSGGYPRLPVAQPLPHTLPNAGGSTGSPSAAPPMSANRVPIDEVIDKVTAMGFSKDQVRAVVRRLTENGQSVDLNIVLDKLMNGESAQAPPKGWFGR